LKLAAFSMLEDFLLCFVPLFITVDAIGVLPLFIGLTTGMDTPQRHRLIRHSVVTALIVASGFLFLGEWLMHLLSITINDFMIAGGILLFLISLSDAIMPEKSRREADPGIGVVPIGIPLIVGPAVLTTSLILHRQYGPVLTIIALALNILIAGLVFWLSPWIYRFLGKNGARVVSKLAAILLAAIAVRMIRQGLTAVLSQTA